jgi:hypothetical protein
MFHSAKRAAGCIAKKEDSLMLFGCMLHRQTGQTVDPWGLPATADLSSLPGVVLLNLQFARKAFLSGSCLHNNCINI